MNEKQFIDWFLGFKNIHGGTFDVPSDWFQAVEANHKEIRKFLGDMRVTHEVELERNEKELIDLDVVAPFDQQFRLLIPQYFITYGWGHSCFQYIVVPSGDQKGMAWGKHMTHWMTRSKIDPETKKKVATAVSKLGAAYAKHKTTKDKYYITLGTDPQFFAAIGHYTNADAQSCFRNGALNETHKYIIGENKNTFVGLVSKKKIESGDKLDVPLMRFWGVADPSFKRFDICNIYPRNPDNQGNVYRSIAKAFGKIIDAEKVAETERAFRVLGVFFNKESPITYSAQDLEMPLAPVHYEFKDTVSNRFRKCFRCGANAAKFEQIDFAQYCTKCASEGFQQCALTGRKTMLRLVAGKKKGKTLAVCESALFDLFKPVGSEYHHIEDIEKVKGKYQLKEKVSA